MVLVRVAYAENIALLAETALRFLEIVQLSQSSDVSNSEESQESLQYKVNKLRMWSIDREHGR